MRDERECVELIWADIDTRPRHLPQIVAELCERVADELDPESGESDCLREIARYARAAAADEEVELTRLEVAVLVRAESRGWTSARVDHGPTIRALARRGRLRVDGVDEAEGPRGVALLTRYVPGWDAPASIDAPSERRQP